MCMCNRTGMQQLIEYKWGVFKSNLDGFFFLFIFFEYPLLSQDRVTLRTSNLAGTFTGSIRTKASLKFWEKRSVGVSRDCQIFSVPPIISGTGKATNYKFCMHILSIDRKQSPLQILGKVLWALVRAF